MRLGLAHLIALTALLLVSLPAVAEAPAWHRTLKDGLKAAKKSGKPVFVTTTWRVDVCATCDEWRDSVRPDEDVARQIARYEPVEWLYDGLDGAVIKWTKANGGTSDDPAVQAFITNASGEVLARATDPNRATSLAKWLREEADRFERANPRTRSAFEYADVTVRIVGTTKRASVSALESAEADERPALVYVARTDRSDHNKGHVSEAKACRKLERTVLDTKTVAGAASDYVRVRLDLSDRDHALFAELELDVTKAPALLLILPGAEKPIVLPRRINGSTLAHHLKKHAK